MIIKGLFLFIVACAALFALASIAFLFFRWVYRTFISESAADKAELRALLDEYKATQGKE